MTEPPDPNPWSQKTRDTWFFGVLASSVVALLVLFSSFATVLVFAGTTVVVTWPLFERMLRLCRGRRVPAAVLTTLFLGAIVFGPIGFAVQRVVIEAVAVAQQGIDLVKSGQVEAWLDKTVAMVELPYQKEVMALLGPDFDPEKAVIGPIQEGLVWLGQSVGGWLPQLIQSIVGGGLDAVIFVGAVISLYAEGPSVLKVMRRLSPMEDDYEERLFFVFQEFANNLVVGSLATAALQGLVAGVGYAIAGVDRLLFASVLTACFSFVPMVGTAVIWVPVAISVGIEKGPFWGGFVAAWSILVTGTVDNLVKPLFLRGSSAIHPMLIFLAVFGGLRWLGLPGVLVGPVLVAGFLALYTIYCQDYLGVEPRTEVERQRPLIDRLLRTVESQFPEQTLPWVPHDEAPAPTAPAAEPPPPTAAGDDSTRT